MIKTDKMQIDFNNTERAFKNKTTADLKSAEWLFSLLNHPILGPLGKTFLKMALKLHLPVKPIIKATLYKHFVGGETLESSLPTVEKLAKQNVMSILDYAREGDDSEEEMENTFRELKRNIEFAAKHEHVAFSVFKMTGLASATILEKVSKNEKLNAEEEQAWQRIQERVENLCSTAHQLNVPLMIDAEDSWYQEAIDVLVRKMMQKYNKEQAIVINTYQMYRHDRLAYLKSDFKKAQEGGYHFGAKLVRGAYMEKERERALEKGYPSPINKTKEDTDRDYNAAVNFCMDHLDSTMLVVASHNDKSNQLAAERFLSMPYKKDYHYMWFSQLLGMCDHISNTLAVEGFNVAKYVPYGPVSTVTPYLIRRADENSSVAGQAKHEIKLLKKELKRRGK